MQAALWCLIGLKVASPLNKSGRRLVAACVHRIKMGVFTTHPATRHFFFLSMFCFCNIRSAWEQVALYVSKRWIKGDSPRIFPPCFRCFAFQPLKCLDFHSGRLSHFPNMENYPVVLRHFLAGILSNRVFGGVRAAAGGPLQSFLGTFIPPPVLPICPLAHAKT